MRTARESNLELETLCDQWRGPAGQGGKGQQHKATDRADPAAPIQLVAKEYRGNLEKELQDTSQRLTARLKAAQQEVKTLGGVLKEDGKRVLSRRETDTAFVTGTVEEGERAEDMSGTGRPWTTAPIHLPTSAGTGRDDWGRGTSTASVSSLEDSTSSQFLRRTSLRASSSDPFGFATHSCHGSSRVSKAVAEETGPGRRRGLVPLDTRVPKAISTASQQVLANFIPRPRAAYHSHALSDTRQAFSPFSSQPPTPTRPGAVGSADRGRDKTVADTGNASERLSSSLPTRNHWYQPVQSEIPLRWRREGREEGEEEEEEEEQEGLKGGTAVAMARSTGSAAPLPPSVLQIEESSSEALLSLRVHQQDLELARLRRDRASSYREAKQLKRLYEEQRAMSSRLRQSAMEGRQREAVLGANQARLERQVVSLERELERVAGELAEGVLEREGWQEEMKGLRGQLKETQTRAEEGEAQLYRALEEQKGLLEEAREGERAAQLQRMRVFEGQLEAALDKFAGAREGKWVMYCVERQGRGGGRGRSMLEGPRFLPGSPSCPLVLFSLPLGVTRSSLPLIDFVSSSHRARSPSAARGRGETEPGGTKPSTEPAGGPGGGPREGRCPCRPGTCSPGPGRQVQLGGGAAGGGTQGPPGRGPGGGGLARGGFGAEGGGGGVVWRRRREGGPGARVRFPADHGGGAAGHHFCAGGRARNAEARKTANPSAGGGVEGQGEVVGEGAGSLGEGGEGLEASVAACAGPVRGCRGKAAQRWNRGGTVQVYIPKTVCAP